MGENNLIASFLYGATTTVSLKKLAFWCNTHVIILYYIEFSPQELHIVSTYYAHFLMIWCYMWYA